MTGARLLLKAVNRTVERSLRVLPRAGACADAAPLAGQRVLMVKLVGMGDAVLMRSVIAHLQRERPDLSIGVLAGPATRAVLETLAGVTMHTFDPSGDDVTPHRGLAKVLELRRAGYDVVIDFEQHLVLVAAFLAMTGIPTRVGLASAESTRSRFQTHSLPLTGDESMWDAYRALARTIAPSLACGTSLPMPVPDPVAAWVDQWWRARGFTRPSRVVALHLGCGSSAVARRWPVSRFAELANHLTRRVGAEAFVLTGTAAELPLAEEFICKSPHPVLDAMQLPSLTHTAEVLRRCVLAVSNDTGVMHLAAAMGTPTIGLFGPNSAARYAPVGPSVAAVYRTALPCSPCIHVHRGLVPECGNPRRGQCLLDIDSSYVASAAEKLLRPQPVFRGEACIHT